MKIMLAVALVAAAAAAPAHAASPFDGTWRADPKTSRTVGKPYVFGVKGGVYRSENVPPIEIPADGAFHEVTGHPYYDEASVKVVGPGELLTSFRKGGKPTGHGTRRLSADGATLTEDYTDTSAPNGTPVQSSGTDRRVAPALPISGSWRDDGMTSASAEALTATLLVGDETLSLSLPTGYACVAPPDGTPVRIEGDPAGAMASVKTTGPRMLVETDLIAGKSQGSTMFTVSPDGRTLDLAFADARSGRVNHIVAHRR